ncbi:quinone-dependent dihydroorotate dehydrogenase [uncultured Ruminobacter sp.]|uniref:quinone-dependent dihydroorotate dehydrogenase n=2 Tax=uncultured Ruminobacter sp. TaxID=538947 RepID=UPI0025EB7CC3|nr:quinone-dependent dihydroorotate dehydrogenase [uncultured Ruminobacter sp.]
MLYSLYQPLIRPCLFTMDPEKAHLLTMKMMSIASRSPLLTSLVSQKVESRPCRVMGLDFPNPVGLAAGLDKDGEAIDAFAALGFGFIEVGTVTPKPQPGNDKPRLFRVLPAEGLINRMGFNNLGVDHLVENIKKSRYKGILGVNIGKNKVTPIEESVNDYLYCLEKVYNYASYVAVNISSPNTPNLRTLQLGDALVELVQALKKKQHELAVANNRYVPIAIKIAPDLSDEEIENICRIFLENDVDGIIATNTTLDREMIANMPHVTEAGGLSGKPEFRKSTDVLAKINKIINGRIPIIGVGGVDSPMAAAEKIKNGASLIQIYSGFIYKGPELIKNIVNYL